MMTPRPFRRAGMALGVLACVTLAGCGDRKDDGAVQAARGGEVLPRSISDDMLPYDTVRSQSGPEPITGAPGRPADDASDAAPAAEDIVDQAEAAEATSSAE